ncbi:MFS transporter [Congregibacter variabilis]|uniref:MFS transporter n=1 Tax=Congregibacter variabilis TaxID=3081200 RepID=A0ABZ0I1J8_9GAMM|nr:MFS transporter [Congregibacter sp. IMCC43200]
MEKPNTQHSVTSQIPTLWVLIAYGSLAFPLAGAFIALQVIVPTYYAQSLGLSLSAIGGILLAARLWDLFTDPVVGYLSDRTPARWGRRKAWVVGSAPLIAASVWLLFNPPLSAGNNFLLLSTLAIYVAGTMSIVPMNAWGAELSESYHQRSRISGVRVIFGLAGTLIALLLVDNSDSESLADSLFAITILTVAGLAISVPFAAVVVPDQAKVDKQGNSLREAISLLSRPSPFRRLLLAFLFNGLGNAIPATLFLLYVTHVLEEPAIAGLMLFGYFVCSALSVPIWVALSRRWGKHRSWCIAVMGSCAFFCIAPFLGSGDVLLYGIVVIGTGLMIGADLALPSAINGDLIEWDALENNRRRPGLFFALWGTASKLAYALAVGLMFPALELAGFDATISNAADDVRLLAVLYAAPSLLFKAAAIAMMWRFPIDEAEHKRIRAALDARGI